MDVIIKKARREDIDACAKLAKTRELEAGPGIYPTEKELLSGMKQGVFLVAKNEEDVLGFTLGYELSRQFGYIDLLVIEENHRGMGLGTKLLNAITKKMRKNGITNIWLIAHENVADMRFYAAKHFKEGDRFRLFWKELG